MGYATVYENGLEGHGDLKPSNLLYSATSHNWKDRTTWPCSEYPWLIKVADLGWADAWRDLGFTNKVAREYAAPERLGNEGRRVVPQASDIFSMGVIVAQLLLGHHPSKNLPAAIKSDGEWVRRANRREWDLNGISSYLLRGLIERCLQPNPELRPSARECLIVLCEELKDVYRQDILLALDCWSTESRTWSSEVVGASDAARSLLLVAGLGEKEEGKAFGNLSNRLETVKVVDFYSLEKWVVLAKGITSFASKSDVVDPPVIDKVRREARQYLGQIFGDLERNTLYRLPQRPDFRPNVQPYERLAELIETIVELAGFDLYEFAEAPVGLSPIAASALAFCAAGDARTYKSFNDAETYLELAITLYRNEAAPYYFRARWREAHWKVKNFIEKKVFESIPYRLHSAWVGDLEKAVELQPEWNEPLQLLTEWRERFGP